MACIVVVWNVSRQVYSDDPPEAAQQEKQQSATEDLLDSTTCVTVLLLDNTTQLLPGVAGDGPQYHAGLCGETVTLCRCALAPPLPGENSQTLSSS